jgi:hypothetical protein
VPKPSAFKVEMVIEKLRRPKSPSIDQIPAEFTRAGGRSIHNAIHEFITSVCNKEKFG